jgi:hypothetical protein
VVRAFLTNQTDDRKQLGAEADILSVVYVQPRRCVKQYSSKGVRVISLSHLVQ